MSCVAFLRLDKMIDGSPDRSQSVKHQDQLNKIDFELVERDILFASLGNSKVRKVSKVRPQVETL